MTAEAALPGWQAWFDGATVPNPGRRGLGAILRGPSGQEETVSRDIGHGTNNEAEYGALIAVLELALQLGVKDLTVHGDSLLVINQVAGEWAIKAAGLRPLCKNAQALIRQIGVVQLKWIKRDKNSEADALSKAAIGYKEGPPKGENGVWKNQTEIAKKVGLSGVAIGKLMDQAGLRNNKKPTELAIELGVALVIQNHFGSQVSWHGENLIGVLRDRGLVGR